MVMKVTLAKIKKVNAPAADPSSQPQNYLLISATVDSLIRGNDGVAPTISFLVAAPPQDGNKSAAPQKKQSWIIFARSGAKAGEVQLISRHAMQRSTPELETRVRAITTELLDTDSPPSFIGIGDAFHISGTIAGEGETQIFLKTDTGAPVSLSVVRRPGQRPHWGVSLGEIVDEAASPPARDTLLWYKLACFLPARLPPESTRTLPLLDAEAARRDYSLVLESLGSCGRTL